MYKLSITEQLCYSTSRIDTIYENGASGSGTGFFYNIRGTKGTIPLIITNKHVVETAIKGIIHFTRADNDGNPLHANHFPFLFEELFAHRWIFHPDPNVDLCAMPIGSLLDYLQTSGKKVFYKGFDGSQIPTEEQANSLDAVENILMVGYPNGIWDSTNNMPIVRRGITATKFSLDYLGKREFLIDAACFPGSSGSPVVICDIGGYTDKHGTLNWGQSRFYLLGVLYAGPQLTVEGEIRVVTIPNLQQKPLVISQIPNNLGFVIKSNLLSDFDDMFLEWVKDSHLLNR